MTPEAAKALIERVTKAIKDTNLPFDLVVRWEETGTIAWAQCEHAATLYAILEESRPSWAPLATLGALLVRPALVVLPEDARKLGNEALDAAIRAERLDPQDPERPEAIRVTFDAAKAVRQASTTFRYDPYRWALLAVESSIYQAPSLFLYVKQALTWDPQTRQMRTEPYRQLEVEQTAMVRANSTCPTTDDLILAVARRAELLAQPI